MTGNVIELTEDEFDERYPLLVKLRTAARRKSGDEGDSGKGSKRSAAEDEGAEEATGRHLTKETLSLQGRLAAGGDRK